MLIKMQVYILSFLMFNLKWEKNWQLVKETMGIQAICFTFHSQARVAWRISNICKSRTMLDLKTPCIVTYFKAIWYKLFKILFCNKKLVVEGADCYVFPFVYLLKVYIHVYTSVMWGNTHGALVHQYHAYISWHALKDGVSCF